MRVAGVAMLDAKAMHLPPLPGVVAGENDDRGRWMDHVAVRTTAKRQVRLALEPDQVRKRVVLAVVEDPAHGCYRHSWQSLTTRRIVCPYANGRHHDGCNSYKQFFRRPVHR
jgi:hypothetical protein